MAMTTAALTYTGWQISRDALRSLVGIAIVGTGLTALILGVGTADACTGSVLSEAVLPGDLSQA